MEDKVKTIQSVNYLENLITERMQEKRRALDHEEQQLREFAEKIKEEMLTKGTTEIEWKEVRIENTTKIEEKEGYSGIMYDVWSDFSRENHDKFRVDWVQETKTVIVPYIEYNDNKYFLHDTIDGDSLPQLIDETFYLALRLKVIAAVEERDEIFVEDLIREPHIFADKVKKLRKSKSIQTSNRFDLAEEEEIFL